MGVRRRWRWRRAGKWAGAGLLLLMVAAWAISGWFELWAFKLHFIPADFTGVVPIRGVRLSRGEFTAFYHRSPPKSATPDTGWRWGRLPERFPPRWAWSRPALQVPGHGPGPSVMDARLPVWTLAAIAAIPTAMLWWRDRRRPDGRCPDCGYNLVGIATGVCPECGGAKR
jgi:hypothetical protein